MYNEERKLAFIKSEESSSKVFQALFKATEKFEKKYNKDLCAMSREQFIEITSNICGTRKNSKGLRLNAIKKYVCWCYGSGFSEANTEVNDIKTGDVDSFGKIRTQYVANPKHLQKYLDAFFDEESKETVSCVYRSYLWLAYAGVFEDDAIDLLCSEVDLDDGIIVHKSIVYELEKESIPAIKRCVRLKYFNYIHPVVGNGLPIEKERAPGEHLLRLISHSEIPSVQTIRVEMSKRRRKVLANSSELEYDPVYEMALSYIKVWISGVFYRMYERERMGIDPSFEDTARRFLDNRGYTFGEDAKRDRTRIKRAARDYMIDYENWKEAFRA